MATTRSGTSDLWLFFLLGLAAQGIGLACALFGAASAEGGALEVVGWVLLGIGGVLTFVAVVGFAVLLGLRAHDDA